MWYSIIRNNTKRCEKVALRKNAGNRETCLGLKASPRVLIAFHFGAVAVKKSSGRRSASVTGHMSVRHWRKFGWYRGSIILPSLFVDGGFLFSPSKTSFYYKLKGNHQHEAVA